MYISVYTVVILDTQIDPHKDEDCSHTYTSTNNDGNNNSNTNNNNPLNEPGLGGEVKAR